MSWIRIAKRGPQHFLPARIQGPIAPPIKQPTVSHNLSPAISNSIWGPALWIILHSACERIGSHTLKKLPEEESRIWFGLLQSLRYSLPCPQCKKHYTSFYNDLVLSNITRESVRNWLYNLHNQVNQRIGKPQFLIEDLIRYEAPFNFTEQYDILQKQMMMSTKQGWTLHEDIQRTLRYLLEMKYYYNLSN